MKVTIIPGKARGKVIAPPSKSMAHRMLIGAGLANGTSVIKNIDLSEDIKATLDILKTLGVRCQIMDTEVIVEGIGGKVLQKKEALECQESGSTLRFFIPLLLTSEGNAIFTGTKRLMERPLDVYENICKEQGISFEKSEKKLEICGKLKPTTYRVPGNISSQFITGLLYALPLLESESVLEILPPIESKNYIEMTLDALKHFGIQIQREGNTFVISGNQCYKAKDAVVEGDYSNAAFLDAFNMLGGKVEVIGLREESLQGDQIYKVYYELLKEDNPIMDISDCPDLGPILMGMAAALNGATFIGTRRLKLKESDRGTVMAQELRKFGIIVDVAENAIVVHKGHLQAPTEILDSHNDHRVAMTLTTLCSIVGGEIEGTEAVRKSFPNYYDVLQCLGIEVRMEG